MAKPTYTLRNKCRSVSRRKFWPLLTTWLGRSLLLRWFSTVLVQEEPKPKYAGNRFSCNSNAHETNMVMIGWNYVQWSDDVHKFNENRRHSSTWLLVTAMNWIDFNNIADSVVRTISLIASTHQHNIMQFIAIADTKRDRCFTIPKNIWNVNAGNITKDYYIWNVYIHTLVLNAQLSYK